MDHSTQRRSAPALAAPLDAAMVAGWVAVLAGAGPGLTDTDRIELLTALEVLKSAAAAAQAAVAVDFDASQRAAQARAGVRTRDLGKGVAAQIALARHESPHRGGRLLGLAHALVDEMPCTLAALRQGRTNEWRATVITRETACLSRAERTEVDRAVWADADHTATLGDRSIAALARTLAYRSDPHAVVNRAAQAAQDRYVSVRPAPDSMTYLTALLPVAHGVSCIAALNQAAQSARAAGDPRSRGQVLADTLTERLTGQATADDIPVTIGLIMTDVTLLGADHEPAQLPDYGPIPAGIARRLAAHADQAAVARIRRLYSDPVTGALVAGDTTTRCFRGALADFVDLRDQSCRNSWCDAPIRHRDHVIEHASGGPTSHQNAQGLCEACNYTKEALGWRARPGPTASPHSVTTITPTGHRYTSRAPDPPGTYSPSTRPRSPAMPAAII